MKKYIDDNMKCEILAYVRDNESTKYVEDFLHELADSSIPVYYSDLIEAASKDIYLATNEPEIFCFDGTHTAVNAIAGNIYEYTMQELYEYWQSIEDDMNQEIDDISFIIDSVCEELDISSSEIKKIILENYIDDDSPGFLIDDLDEIISEITEDIKNRLEN